ncbi:MAG: glycosyltransferase family 4 protein, partial [Candidatus Omnitrophota bacterium]|nr:glycosyltransferase family 4 protein [Candidatus Omnitrophota bacterium]
LAKAIFRNKIRLVLRIQVYTASRALDVKKSRWRFRIIKKIERFALCQADLVIPISKFTYDLVVSQGVRPDKIVILPVPVLWFKDAKITDLPTTNRILFVGRLEKEKGLHILLHAMVMAKKEVPNIHLLIAGEGTFRSVLEQIVRSLGIYEHVSFLGWLKTDDLRNLYKEAYILILPSIMQEGLGMVLVEAGLMGRPVVASNIGGIGDIVRHGENGLLVPSGDAKALADAIVTTLKDRALAQRMGVAGARIAREYLQKRTEAVECVHKAIYELMGDGLK